MRVIEVLGPGCQKCQYTEKVVREVVDAAGIDAEVRTSPTTARSPRAASCRRPGSSSTVRSSLPVGCRRASRSPPGWASLSREVWLLIQRSNVALDGGRPGSLAGAWREASLRPSTCESGLLTVRQHRLDRPWIARSWDGHPHIS